MVHKKRNHLWLGFPCFFVCMVQFVASVSSETTLWLDEILNRQSEVFFQWFLKLKLSTKPIVPHGRALCQKRFSCVPFCLRSLWPSEIWRVPSADFRPQFVGEGWTRLLQGCSLPSAAWVSRSRRQPWVLLLMLQPKRSPINSQTLSQEAAGGSKTKT